MDGIIFCKNTFGNIITSMCLRASKEAFLGIKEISWSQQFKVILKNLTYERSVK